MRQNQPNRREWLGTLGQLGAAFGLSSLAVCDAAETTLPHSRAALLHPLGKHVDDLREAIQALWLAEKILVEVSNLPEELYEPIGRDLYSHEVTTMRCAAKLFAQLLEAQFVLRCGHEPECDNPLLWRIRRHVNEARRGDLPGIESAILALALASERLTSIRDFYCDITDSDTVDELDEIVIAAEDFCCTSIMRIGSAIYFDHDKTLAAYQAEVS